MEGHFAGADPQSPGRHSFYRFRSEKDAVFVSDEERKSQGFFQPPDVMADGGLGQEQGFCGGSNAFVFGDIIKDFVVFLVKRGV